MIKVHYQYVKQWEKNQILKNPLYKAVHPWELINQAYASLMSHWRIQVFPRESNRNSPVTKHSKYLGANLEMSWKGPLKL